MSQPAKPPQSDIFVIFVPFDIDWIVLFVGVTRTGDSVFLVTIRVTLQATFNLLAK